MLDILVKGTNVEVQHEINKKTRKYKHLTFA